MSETQTLDEFLESKVIGHKSQALEPRLPRVAITAWDFDKAQKVPTDLAPYFKKHLAVCLELEYNGKGMATSGWENKLNGERDMIFKDYHDCTLNSDGREFVIKAIQGLSSEEFAARLPLKVFREHFTTATKCGMHSHSILFPFGAHQPIPTVIATNAWQLFKAFYPGWVYLFGNYPGRMLRSTWGVWQNTYAVSNPPSFEYRSMVRSLTSNGSSSIDFGRCSFNSNGTVSNWDVEIRTTDSTHELDQIIACRAMSKAIFVRAADLANVGLIRLPEGREELVKELASDLQYHFPDDSLEERRGPEMQKIAVAFYNEMRPYLSAFEKRNVKSCLINPVRQRGVVNE
jgi:hypothetical protein